MQEFIIQNQYTLGVITFLLLFIIIFSVKFYKTNKRIKGLLSTVKNIDNFDIEIQKQISRVNNTITELYKEIDDKNDTILNLINSAIEQSKLYSQTRLDLLNSIKIQQKVSNELLSDSTLFIDKVEAFIPEQYKELVKINKTNSHN